MNDSGVRARIQNLFPGRLTLSRQRNHLSQSQLAKLVEVSAPYVNRMERGWVLPGIPTLVDLCLVLHVSSDYMVGLIDEEVVEIS